jgi:hypothetical protein
VESVLAHASTSSTWQLTQNTGICRKHGTLVGGACFEHGGWQAVGGPFSSAKMPIACIPSSLQKRQNRPFQFLGRFMKLAGYTVSQKKGPLPMGRRVTNGQVHRIYQRSGARFWGWEKKNPKTKLKTKQNKKQK